MLYTVNSIADGMKVRRILITVFAAAIIGGCTSRELYSYGQEYQREQCRNGPLYDYEECMRRANESYETYQRQRKEVEEDR